MQFSRLISMSLISIIWSLHNRDVLEVSETVAYIGEGPSGPWPIVKFHV